MMTSRRSIIIFWTLLLVPAMVLAGFAFRQLSFEQERIRRAGITALGDQARLVAQNLDQTMATIQANLTRSLLDINAKDLSTPGLREKIFNKFFRADNSLTTSKPGSGLGLSITRHMLRDLGGDIVMDTTLARGAGFIIRIPIHE